MMEREKAQALLRNYAEALHWPYLQVFNWSLDEKYQWKQFINLAEPALLLLALAQLRAQYQMQQELAG